MFDVSHKPDTARRAYAQAILQIKNPTTVKMIIEGNSPKGDVIQAARVAGTMAAKRTWDILPYCHSIPVDYVNIDFSFDEPDSVLIYCETKSIWKTGVEMEALTGVAVAALTVYDMIKPADDSVQIGGIRLLHKSGGLSEIFAKNGGKKRGLTAAVIVASDSRSPRSDESGKFIVKRLSQADHFKVVGYKVIPDELEMIQSELERLCDSEKVDLVLTSGGTGIGPHDMTPEATTKVIDIELRGISEALRMHGQRRTPTSMLSRGISGIRKQTIIVNLPGSVSAASESLDALFPALVHAFEVLHGHEHRKEAYRYEHRT